MDAVEKNFASRTLTLLRDGPFRRFIIGSAISDTGTWMQVMAQGYVMSTLTNKALLLGMANFAAGLPMLALTISIGLLIMSGKIAIWHIFGFAMILGISNSFEMPTLNAFVPELVARN